MSKPPDIREMTELARSCGFCHAAVAAVKDISFSRDFRAACAQNTCGHYGACWMCPPDVGDIDEMIARARTYERVCVFQSVGRLEDSFDIEGMQNAARRHNEMAQAFFDALAGRLNQPLRLGAGACQVCDRCARRDGAPCRRPDRATASLEAYGVAVSELARVCGMRYMHGPGTVTFFGGVFY